MSRDRQAGAGNDRIAAPWMLSFVDLVTLVTAFFVLQIAMTQIEPGAWDGIRDGLADRFGHVEATAPAAADAPASLDHRYVEAILARVAAMPPMAGARVFSASGRAVLVLPRAPDAALDAALPALAAMPDAMSVVAVLAPGETAAAAIARAGPVAQTLATGGKAPVAVAAVPPADGLDAGVLALAFAGAAP